jgi:hypothetical protein
VDQSLQRSAAPKGLRLLFVVSGKRLGLVLLLAAAHAWAGVNPNGAFVTSVPIELPPHHSITPTLLLQYDSQAGNGPLGVGWSLTGLSQIRRTSPTAVSQRSSLVKITPYGRSAALDASGTPSGASLPPVVLGYANPSPTQGWQTRRSAPTAVAPSTTPTLMDQFPFASQAVNLGVDAGYLMGDFDGDGRSDTLVHTLIEDPSVASGFFTQMGSLAAHLELHVRLATRAAVSTQLPLQVAGHWIPTEPPQDGREKLARLWVADANGDGMDDLLGLSWRAFDNANPYGAVVLTVNAALSNGQGGFEWARPNFADTPWITNVVWGERNFFAEDSPLCTPGDFNGDGRADLACAFQNSGGKHFLGVAHASANGALNPGLSAEEIADDPGVAVPGTSGFVPFETRRIAAGDVDGDGLTDLIVLDLNPADVAACADLGDPTVNRPTCSIRYDLLTMISRGDGQGFERERTPTPWKREDFLHIVPGHIAAADLNGDGRADMVFFAGPVKGERFQRLRSVRTAIRRNAGYTLSELAVPQALANTELHFSMGDANGDGRTDLLVATRIGPGTAGVNCSSRPQNRAVLTVVLANPDGALDLPQRWDDCAVSREITDAWAPWTPANLAMVQVGDTNGDGYADFVMPVVYTGQTGQIIFIVHDRVAQPGPQAPRRWITADLNADGRSDFMALVPQTNSTAVISLIAQPTGGWRSEIFPLGTFDNSALRSWHVLDADGDGRSDLVHVACASSSHGPGCALQVQSFLSRGDGSFTREAVVSVPALANVHGNSPLDWLALDIDRDGRGDLVQPLTLRDPASGSTRLVVRGLRSLGPSWQALNVTPVLTSAPAQFAGRAAWKAGDFDGDGRGDLLHITSGRNDARLTLLKFNGSVWQATSSALAHPAPTGGWVAWRGATSPLAWRAADVNGDGVTDLVRALRSSTGQQVHALESLGGADWHNTLSPLTVNVPLEGFGGNRWQLLDVNGDGAADWLHLDDTLPNNLQAYLLPGGGAGFSAMTQTTVENASRRFVPRPMQQWGDLQGDGRSALMGIEAPASANTAPLRVQSLLLPLAREVITSVDAGAKTAVTYRPAVSDAGTFDCALPAGLQLAVVSELAMLDGRSPHRDVTRFGYGCAAWSHAHRTLLGWRETVSSRAAATHRPASVERAQYQIVASRTIIRSSMEQFGV